MQPVDGATSDNSATILARWNRFFTALETWVPDQGPHFINNTLTVLASDYHILHKPTVAYSPWANGTVESLMRIVLTALLSMMFELKMAPQDWKEIISAIPTIINYAGLERLGYNNDGTLRSPLQVMTGILPNRPIARIISFTSETSNVITVSQVDATKLFNIDALQSNLHQLHRDVSEK